MVHNKKVLSSNNILHLISYFSNDFFQCLCATSTCKEPDTNTVVCEQGWIQSLEWGGANEKNICAALAMWLFYHAHFYKVIFIDSKYFNTALYMYLELRSISKMSDYHFQHPLLLVLCLGSSGELNLRWFWVSYVRQTLLIQSTISRILLNLSLVSCIVSECS